MAGENASLAAAHGAASATDIWLGANPWCWVLSGLGLSGAALAWVRLWGEAGTGVRLVLIALALVLAGTGVILRLRRREGVYMAGLSPAGQRRAVWALAGASALLALLSTGLLLAAYGERDLPWEADTLVWVWLATAPPAALAAGFFYRCGRAKALPAPALESACLLVGLAITAFLAAWALYVDEDHALDWDTGRLFLAVVAAVAYAAAFLVLLPAWLQRLFLSGLIVFHFAGIATVALSPPPSPWIITQLYGRIFRPYLEFMYLINAYHFYAPDPGPASYIWARIEYVNERGEHFWHWRKVPELDERGRPCYWAAVAYQRRIALLDNSRGIDTAPPLVLFNKDGRQVMHPIYYWRLVYSNQRPEALVGKPMPPPKQVIPFQPDLSWETQYQPVNALGRQLLSAFAQHLCRQPRPGHPEERGVSVKIYRVVHYIPPPGLLQNIHIHPAHPVTFFPYYQGHFDAEGKLLDAPQFTEDGNLVAGDPLLYWLIPIIADPRDPQRDDRVAVLAWVFLHAGDARWYRPHGSQEWVPLDPQQVLPHLSPTRS